MIAADWCIVFRQESPPKWKQFSCLLTNIQSDGIQMRTLKFVIASSADPTAQLEHGNGTWMTENGNRIFWSIPALRVHAHTAHVCEWILNMGKHTVVERTDSNYFHTNSKRREKRGWGRERKRDRDSWMGGVCAYLCISRIVGNRKDIPNFSQTQSPQTLSVQKSHSNFVQYYRRMHL